MTTTTRPAPDLAALNSATKYPSIPTYHTLDPKNGGLLETAVGFGGGEVILTEKVDGTNGRIVVLPDGDYVIGSREELLYARGDRVGNPALGIVDALKPLAERLAEGLPGRQPEGYAGGDGHGERPGDGSADGIGGARIRVYFLEVYGHKIGGAAKQYTAQGRVGHRLFDLAVLTPEVLDQDQARISAWREGGGQQFCTEDALQRAAAADGIALTPRLGVLPPGALPTSVEATHAWLAATLPGTHVALDESAGGSPEGIVLRTPDRATIAKARFQDYARTLRRRSRRA